VGRRVDGDVREIITTQSRWLFDLARSRFQRCAIPQDLDQALAFGSWTPLTDVRVEEGHLLVVEPRDDHPVRAEITTDVNEPGALHADVAASAFEFALDHEARR
jgi:hypothetical protein